MTMNIITIMRHLDTPEKRLHAFVFMNLAKKDPAWAAFKYTSQLEILEGLAPKAMTAIYEIDVLDMQAHMVTSGLLDLDDYTVNHASKIVAVMDYRARVSEYKEKGLEMYINDWIRELAG